MNNVYTLYERVADLTLWMNETLPLLINSSLPKLETIVETLSTSVLPSAQRALVSNSYIYYALVSNSYIRTSIHTYVIRM